MNLLNTSQTAERLGVSVRRVRALIAEGRLKAHPIGREYAIEETALESVTVYGKPGRPKTAAPVANATVTAAQPKKTTGKGTAAVTKPAKKRAAKKGRA